MSKYVCESCHNGSDMPGVCQTPGCPMNGQPLKEMPDENMDMGNAPMPAEENPEAADTMGADETPDMPPSNPETGAPEAPAAGNDEPATPPAPADSTDQQV